MSNIPSVRVFTPEILWHDKFSPILSIDYEPQPITTSIPTDSASITQSTNQSTIQSNNQSNTESVRRIVTAGVDKSIRIWSLSTEKSIKSTNRAHQSINQPNFTFLSQLSYHQSAVNVVKFSPDGRLIASADDNGSVAVWQRQGNEVIEVTEEIQSTEQSNNELNAQPVDPTIEQSSDQTINQPIDISSDESDDQSNSQPATETQPMDMSDEHGADSDKGNALDLSNLPIDQSAEHSTIQSTTSCDTPSDSPINPLKQRMSAFVNINDDSVQHIEPFNSPKPVVNSTIKQSNNQSNNQTADQPTKEANPLTNDDDEIDSLCSEKWVRVTCFKAHVDSIYALSWSPNCDMIATTCIDGQLSIWAIKGPRLIVSIPAHSGYIQGCVWDPIGQLLATVSNDRTCNLFQVQSSKVNLVTTLKNSKQLTTIDSPSEPLPNNDNDEARCTSPTPRTPSSSIQSNNQSSIQSTSLPLFIDESLPSFFRRPSWSPDARFLLAPAGLRVDDQRGGLPIKSNNQSNNQTNNQSSNQSNNQLSDVSDKPSENQSDKPVIKSKDEIFCTYLFNRDALSEGPASMYTHGEPSIATAWSPHYYTLTQIPGYSAMNDICNLPYLQVFAIATTRAVYVYTTHDPAPVAVVSSIHLEQLTDITWQHLPNNQSDNESANQSLVRILVTSIDGYVSVIELDHLFERVSECDEAKIRAEMMSRQPVKHQSNKPKRKRLRKLKQAAESDDEPTAEHTDNEEKPAVEIAPSADAPLLSAEQLIELQALAAANTRVTVDLVRSKYTVSRVKASKMWREFKAAQDHAAEQASATKQTSKPSIKESIKESIKKSAKLSLKQHDSEETDSDDQIIERSTKSKQSIKPTPRKKVKLTVEPVTPVRVDEQSTDTSINQSITSTPADAPPSTQRKSVKRKAVDATPIDKGMKKLDCFFAAGEDDESLESTEVITVKSASKPKSKSKSTAQSSTDQPTESEVKFTPAKRAKSSKPESSVKSAKSAKSAKSEKTKSTKTEKTEKTKKSKSKASSSTSSSSVDQSDKQSIDLSDSPAPADATITDPQTPIKQSNKQSSTSQTNVMSTREPSVVKQPSFAPIPSFESLTHPTTSELDQSNDLSTNQTNDQLIDRSITPPIEPIVKKRVAPTLMDLLNSAPRSNSFSKRVMAPEPVIINQAISFPIKQTIDFSGIQSSDNRPSTAPAVLTDAAAADQQTSSAIVVE